MSSFLTSGESEGAIVGGMTIFLPAPFHDPMMHQLPRPDGPVAVSLKVFLKRSGILQDFIGVPLGEAITT